MDRRWVVVLGGIALAATTSAAPRGPQASARVEDAQVVQAKVVKKKVVRSKTTTRRTHTESHSSSSRTPNRKK